MSSATSTDAHTFRPWHLFALAGLLASTVAVVVVRPGDPVVLALLVAAIGSAAAVGFALYRMLWPLAAIDVREKTQIIGGRTRAALEREKTLVLRSIKELEFDRAMGKVSAEDFRDMAERLRAQALGLMKQLDVEVPAYRDVIEKELAQRLGVELGDVGVAADDTDVLSEAEDEADAERSPEDAGASGLRCEGCGTENDPDARFCKGCGSPVEGSA